MGQVGGRRYRPAMTTDPLSLLDERGVDRNPFVQFAHWYDVAVVATTNRAAAMTVATVDGDGHPHARVVLLRGFDERGFAFFTNYDSSKGHELAASPNAAAVLYWSELDAQVRIEGPVAKVSEAESDEYFAGRPRGHQIGAWASAQSAPVKDRAALEAAVAAVERRFPGEVPRPPHWGGYRITPLRVEFWRSRTDRVHDRVSYRREGVDAAWVIERLSP